MERRLGDSTRALVGALVLLASASFILFFIHPGGFEGQIGWFLLLMPGAIIGLSVADRVYKISASAEPFALWGIVIPISLLWYFAISYAAIKAYRFIVRRPH